MSKAAVLVNLTIHAFVNEKSDRKIANEVAEKHNIKGSTDRYLKKQLPPWALAPIERILVRMRQYHAKVTSPWYPGGIGMMPASYIIPFRQAVAEMKGDLQVEIGKLCAKLPNIDAEMKRNRGTLYTAPPSAAFLKQCWEIDVELLPVPRVGDFRIEHLEQRVKDDFKEKTKERFEAQDDHVKELFLQPLLRLKQTFLTESPRVRASTIENLEWVCEHTPDLCLSDKSKEKLTDMALFVKANILPSYNPDGRPKFDMEAIEGALDIIKRIEEELA